MFLWTDRYQPVSVPNYDQLGSLSYCATLIIRQWASIDVPSFLFVSGFFIAYAAGGSQKQLKWKVVINRIRTLVVPFILWTVIRFALIRKIPSSIQDVLEPYYYIVLISQLFLISPFLIAAARSGWKWFLASTGLLHIFIQSLRYALVLGEPSAILNFMISITPNWLFPVAIFWFAFGLVVGMQSHSFHLSLGKYKWLVLCICLIMGALTVFEYNLVAYLAGEPWLGPAFPPIFTRFTYTLFFLLSFVAFGGFSLPNATMISKLGSKSLGVYFGNQNACFVLAFVMYHIFPWILDLQFIYQPILILGGLGLPLLLMMIVRQPKLMKYYSLLFG